MAADSRPDRVWYVAYGSNLCEARFLRYLRGGPPEPGARDATPPRRSVFTTAPLVLRFGHESVRWNRGGVAFVDPHQDREDLPHAHVRAWDLTVEQFEDVFAQENRLEIPTALPWKTLLEHGQASVGIGWYQRLLTVDAPHLDGQPAVTFTWAAPVPHNDPDDEYLATIRQGLVEGGLDSDDIEGHLRTALCEPRP